MCVLWKKTILSPAYSESKISFNTNLFFPHLLTDTSHNIQHSFVAHFRRSTSYTVKQVLADGTSEALYELAAGQSVYVSCAFAEAAQIILCGDGTPKKTGIRFC